MDWRSFHDHTNHHPDRHGGQSDDPSRPQSMDPQRRPEPFKSFEEPLSTVALSEDIDTWTSSARHPEQRAPLDFDGLSRILLVGAGAKRFKKGRLVGRYFRTYASAGALHPNEVYVAAADLDGLSAGLYHFNSKDKALTVLGKGDPRPALARATVNDSLINHPVVLIVSGIPWRTSWKYGPRGYRHLWWDAGMIIANILALADSVGQRARVMVQFADDLVNEAIGVDARSEMALALVAIGEGALATKGPFEPFSATAAPISNDPYEFPEITAVHRETSISSVDGIRYEFNEASKGIPAPIHLEDGPVEKVILKRGSARDLDGEATIDQAALRTILRYAAAHFVGDWGRTLNELFVVAHGVSEIPPGPCVWTGEELETLTPDPDSRESAHFLSLNQALGGNAAAVVFPMADLDEAAQRLGPRGYRAAQLEGAIISGRLYLASYAAGLGATGLTFYDEEVSKYFGTHKEPMLEVAIGKPAPRRARPALLPSPANLDFSSGHDARGIPLHWSGRTRGYRVDVGNGVLRIESVSKRADWGSLGQTLQAASFVGKRVSFSAEMAVDCEGESEGALYLRVDGPAGVMAFDRMQDRPLTGKHVFHRQTLELEVPTGAEGIGFGILLLGKGSVEVRNLRLEPGA